MGASPAPITHLHRKALPLIVIVPNWHPVFVHVTVALLPTAALLFLAARALDARPVSAPLLAAARINLWAGVLLSLVTVGAGFWAMTHAVQTEVQLATAKAHAGAAMGTAVIWWALALWDGARTAKAQRPALVFVLLTLAAVVPLGGTGWLGAELVFHHGVGVQQATR